MFNNLKAVADYINGYTYDNVNGRDGIKPFKGFYYQECETMENAIVTDLNETTNKYGKNCLFEVWEKKSGGYVVCIKDTIYDKVGIDRITALYSNRVKADGSPLQLPIEIKFKDKKLVVGGDRKKQDRLTLAQVVELWITLSLWYKQAVIEPVFENEGVAV